MHVCITSINFDKSPEGICTGLLIRALLDAGIRITLITSSKADTRFNHPQLNTVVINHKPREPRIAFTILAVLRNEFAHNFYQWGRKASHYDFGGDVPDVFYGRAWPYSSLIPAQALAEKFNKPFIAHLSDPIPPPNESLQTRFIEHLNQVIRNAAALTFTNQETVDYQNEFTPFGNTPVYVVNHVAPAPVFHEIPQQDNQLYYIGAIGNRKSVLPLLFEGFKALKAEVPNSALNFVNPKQQDIEPALKACNMANEVKILPFAEDINSVIQPASVLISLEPKVERPMWTLTKTIHYLFNNRKIFALTSPNSPTQRILSQFPESCVVVTEYSAAAITQGLQAVLSLQPNEAHYQQRLNAMSSFTPASISQQLKAIFRAAQP